MAGVFDSATLKMWHGGAFKNGCNGDLIYVGGKAKTFEIDPDALCLHWLMDLAKSCGNYNVIEGFFYRIPKDTTENCLRKVENDDTVREMLELMKNSRCLEVYVLHGLKVPALTPTVRREKLPIQRAPQVRSSPRIISPTKLNTDVNPHTFGEKDSPQKAPASSKKQKKDAHTSVAATNSSLLNQSPQPIQSIPNTLSKETQATTSPLPQPSNTNNEILHNYDWIDPRPPSPIPWKELLEVELSGGSDSSDPNYIPGSEEKRRLEQINESGLEDLDELDFEEEDEEILDDELQYQSDSGDEEYILARQRVRDTTAKLVDNAKQIQKQAAKGQNIPHEGEAGEPSTVESGFQSEYEDSEEEIHTPPNSGDEALDDGRKRRSGLLVSKFTDFASFKWKVGQKFATRGEFKNAVAKYGILQGRDVHFTVSNKHRQQRLGVKCIESCPFYVYASWDSRRATVVVKTVKGEHSCQRNMKRNRQLKSTWVADQFLEVFKNRPHWPASEIQECVRKAYRMLVSKHFAYKVKYAAHKKLHGSMHDHYNKLGGYMEALKASSPDTYMEIQAKLEVEKTKAAECEDQFPLVKGKGIGPKLPILLIHLH
ncbi:Presenilin spe-4 [Bienertia sinuspersici]